MVNTKEKYGLKTGHAIVLFAIMILNIVWIVCNFILFSGHLTIHFWLSIFMYLAAAFYASYGYKKPHGMIHTLSSGHGK